MENINLIFNFIGVSVVDWQPAFKFFSETLGLKYQLEPQFGDWAIFSGNWESYSNEHNHSASADLFELFDRGRSATERHWGLNQGIRPAFHVSNLQHIIKKLDIPFKIEERPWGKIAEFSTTEGICFAFAEIHNAAFSKDLSVPGIGHMAVKCADFDAMKSFYGDVLGFTKVDEGADYVLFAQPEQLSSIILERGGSASTFDVRNTQWEANAVRAFPVFPGLMTTDIQAAHAYLQAHNVTIQRAIISHEDWGGTDFHIADPDGNGIQIVQYK